MKIARILLTASMLMAGTLGSWANQTIPLHTGFQFVTCQTIGSPNNNLNNPLFFSTVALPSDPNGVNNAVLYWWGGSGFSIYQYFTGADADDYFLMSGSTSGFYDAVGNLVNVTWNPGVGAGIKIIGASSSITFSGTDANSTFRLSSFPVGYDLRGSPTPGLGFVLPSDIVSGVPLVGDTIYVFNPSLPGCSGSITPNTTCFDVYYYDPFQGTAGGWVPKTPHITPNYEAVFVKRGGLSSAVIEGTVIRKNATCGSLGALPNWTVQAQDSSSLAVYYGITGPSGRYAIPVPPSSGGSHYTVTAQPLGGWTQIACSGNPLSYLVTAAAATFYTGKDFYEQATDGPLQKDLAVDLVSLFPYPLRSPCCGQNMTYVVSARNSGTLGLAGVSVVLNFPPTQTPTVPLATALTGFPAAWVVDALNSYPTVPGQVTWKRATAWGAKASQNFTCTVTLPASPCAGPLSATATIKPIASDVHLADNSSTLNQQITCSHDPNDMQVSPAGCGPQGFVPAGQPLTYLIRFQNTGNGPAYQVVVSNKLSANLDVSTLQVLGSSHPNAVQIQGNQLVFNFPNIYLPAQSDDDLGSQGYVKYQVLPLGAAPVGALIANNAAIYFDRNAPVLTVTTTNTLTADPLPVATFSLVQRIGSTGHTNDFTYTGGTAGATYLWSFGPDATPSTSTAQNPTGVVFATDGDKLVGLQVSLGSCQTEPAVQIVHVGVPSLTTDMVDGQLVLSWQGSGYHLQERTGLQPGTPWSATSATVTQVESSYAATPVMDSATKFYRLSQVAP